jgi:putative ABC transport system permease protein
MVGSALVISILTVADHLAVGVLERRHELALLQAVGWRAGAVSMSLLMEGIWLGLLGGLIGAVAAIGIGIPSQSEAILSAWWVVPVGLLVMLVMCGLSALFAIFLTPGRTLVGVMLQQQS